MRRKIAFTALLLGILGLSSGVIWARKNYAGVCGQLSGIPGILQSVSLLRPNGTCTVASDAKTCLAPGAACTVPVESGDPIPGLCRQLKDSKNRNVNCQCKPTDVD